MLLLSSGENIVVNKIFSLINIKISLSKEIIVRIFSILDGYKVLKFQVNFFFFLNQVKTILHPPNGEDFATSLSSNCLFYTFWEGFTGGRRGSQLNK